MHEIYQFFISFQPARVTATVVGVSIAHESENEASHYSFPPYIPQLFDNVNKYIGSYFKSKN
jgi:hypothetical protein